MLCHRRDRRTDDAESGRVFVASTDLASNKAADWIRSLTADAEKGQAHMGKVTRIMNFGAFVEILPGKGMIPPNPPNERVAKVEDVVNIGDEVTAWVIEIDNMVNNFLV